MLRIYHAVPGSCALMRFVPAEQRRQAVPCHHIPLDGSGCTVATLEQEGDRQKLEEKLKGWLRTQISQLDAAQKA